MQTVKKQKQRFTAKQNNLFSINLSIKNDSNECH